MHIETLHIEHPFTAVGYVAATSAGFALIVYISSFAWKLTLEFLYGKKIAYNEIRDVYVKANIGKYIGGIGHFAGRNVLGKKLGFSQIDMALSTIIEIITLMITACLWSFILAYKNVKKVITDIIINYSPWLFVALVAVVLAIIAMGIVYAYKKDFLQKYRKLFSLGFFKLFALLFLIYSLTMLIPGMFLVLMYTQALGSALSLQSAVVVVAAYMISWALGYVVPIPGGLGVREVALLAILTPVGGCGAELTAVAMILHRVASILGDVIAFIFEVILARKTRKG
jgi:glycosyltransferase 2 family protein